MSILPILFVMEKNFLLSGDIKALEEKEYKEELEKSGKMQKHMKRKAKKLASKEKKKKAWTTQDI